MSVSAASQAPDLYEIRSAHLVGIGGTAMTPLATILLQMGVQVSGSDLDQPAHLEALRSLGAHIEVGHKAEHVGQVDVVVVSSAIPADNPEVAIARERGVPVVKHSAALGSLMRRRRGVAVAGTHGKTTTSALLAVLLDQAQQDPTFHVGSEVLGYGAFGHYGRGPLLVAEADEYDRRFLDYEPEIAVVTSVEPDHLDYFGDFSTLASAFEAFLAQVRPGGAVFVCADDQGALDLRCGDVRRITYGFAADADWQVLEWRPASRATSALRVRGPDGAPCDLEVTLLGAHNAANACAAVAVAAELGVSASCIARGLAAFRGTRRRFEVVGEAAGVTVVDDYAHHPTAIRATLAAARAHYHTPIRALFQPHTAHRTMSLFDEFRRCFADAHEVVLVPTYRPPGREAEATDASVEALAREMDHPSVRFMAADEAADHVAAASQAGELVLVIGAGDISRIEPHILEGLARRELRG